jgi:hypothetical protein
MSKVLELIRLKWISAKNDYDIKSYFLPCQHCKHECSIDAKTCPNCGTPSPFGISSRIKLYFFSIFFFLVVSICAFVFIDPIAERNYLLGFGEIMFGASVISMLLMFLANERAELLKHASRVKTQHPEKFYKIWNGL